MSMFGGVDQGEYVIYHLLSAAIEAYACAAYHFDDSVACFFVLVDDFDVLNIYELYATVFGINLYERHLVPFGIASEHSSYLLVSF